MELVDKARRWRPCGLIGWKFEEYEGVRSFGVGY